MPQPADYIQNELIPAIVARRPYRGLRVFGDANTGSIYLILDDDGAGWELYATPDYEGRENTLPLDGVDDDGVCHESMAAVRWTGDVDRDVALWADHVSAAVAEKESND